MACSCRTAPLRSFLSGLAQVHRLESSSQVALQRWSQASLPSTRHRQNGVLRQLRGFHSSKSVAQEAAATSSDVPETTPAPAPTPTVTSSAVAEGITESTSAAKPKKKKQRWRDKEQSEVERLKEEQAKKEQAKIQGEGTKKKKPRNSNKPQKSKNPKKSQKQDPEDDGITEKQGVRTIRRKDGIIISTRSTGDANKLRNGPGASAATLGKPRRVEDAAKGTEPSSAKDTDEERKDWPDWRIQKEALKEKFPDGWRPRKRLSPDALAGIRALNAQYPDIYTTAALSAKFEVDPEAIRRILKSKWQPSTEQEEKRLKRWRTRGAQIWETKAALGVKPPKQWREEGISRDPSWHAWRRKVAQREQEWEDEEKRLYREKRAASLQSRLAGKVL